MAEDDDDDRMERQLWFGRAVHVYQIPSRESASRGYRCLHVVWQQICSLKALSTVFVLTTCLYAPLTQRSGMGATKGQAPRDLQDPGESLDEIVSVRLCARVCDVLLMCC